MHNPLRRLKQLPWLSLFLIALLTLFWASVLEIVLHLSASQFALISRALTLLLEPPLGILMAVAIAMGIGALAVLFLEIIYPQLFITTGVLWALVLCLFVATFLRDLLPFPTNLEPSYLMLIGNMLGIFTKGKPYWR